MTQFKRFAFLIVVLAVGYFAFSSFTAKADPVTYYFNNAVNTSPNTLGNYWYDYDATNPALELPDFDIDIITVLPDSTFDGNIVFRQESYNYGTITGNAEFYDISENDGTVQGNVILWDSYSRNFGTINGTKTQHYITGPGEMLNDYTSNGPWTLIADGVTVGDSGGTFDETTVFSEINGGNFIFMTLGLPLAFGANLDLTYSNPLNESSVPAASDFSVVVNGENAVVNNVTVSGSIATLHLASPVSPVDIITATYVPGLNPIQRIDGFDAEAFSQVNVIAYVPIAGSGSSEVDQTVLGNKVYVTSPGNDSVSVINAVSNVVLATIPVGDRPSSIVAYQNKVYVTNRTSGTVSVINAVSDTVEATITVNAGPYYSAVVGSKIYIGHFASNTIAVIDPADNTVEATIPVGTRTESIAVVGSKVYAINAVSQSATVIDSSTNTVITTIAGLGGSPRFSTVVGNKVYVATLSGFTKVINSLTDTISSSIATGSVSDIASVGNKVYVSEYGGASIKVLNTSTDTISSTITVCPSTTYLAKIAVVGERVYSACDGNDPSLVTINTNTDLLVDRTYTVSQPINIVTANNKLFLASANSGTLKIIDLNVAADGLPNLTSFTTSLASGTYSAGTQITITAHFGRILANGSTMTLMLNSGASVVLNNPVGKTLSGTYTVAPGQTSPDLSVASITSASITDIHGNNRTSYSLPQSFDNLSGELPFITRNLGDTKNISLGSFTSVAVGSNPAKISPEITVDGVNYIYVANQGDNTVSVVRSSDKLQIDTIVVGSEPYDILPVEISGTTYLYVSNVLSNTISVIDTSDNSVAATIAVGVRPHSLAKIGTDIYVTNTQSNTVSVIDTTDNTVSATVPVGLHPRGIVAYGTDLYVANYGDANYSGGNYISVIDSSDNTVSDTIILSSSSYGPFEVTASSDRIYVSNERSNNVSVINPASNAITATINVGSGPRAILSSGSYVYVENFNDSTISVINTSNNAVIDSVVTGNAPMGMALIGSNIYFSNYKDNNLLLLDPTTNTLRSVSETPVSGGGGSSGGGSAYVAPSTPSEPIVTPPAPTTPNSSESPQAVCEVKRNLIKEILIYEKYVLPLVRGLVMTDNQRFAITNFIAYCSDATAHLGEGERAGVLASYKDAFGRLPLSEADWKDLELIAVGKWPLAKNRTTELRAAASFKTLFGRVINYASNGEINAMKMMAYGVLQVGPRNLLKEQNALTIFRKTFNILPTLTRHWNIIRTLAYSGINK